jgi:hypothetical protein
LYELDVKVRQFISEKVGFKKNCKKGVRSEVTGQLVEKGRSGVRYENLTDPA